MEKVVRDGKTAILYSPGYGAGWVTWNSTSENAEKLIFDSEIVEAILEGDKSRALARATEICPDGYFGGLCDLCVEWVPCGNAFEIREYDGFESIHVLGEGDYFIA